MGTTASALSGAIPMKPIGGTGSAGSVPTLPVAGVPTTGTPGITSSSATNVGLSTGTGTMMPLSGTPATAQTGATPTFGGTSISSGLNTTDGSNTLTGDFKDTYGAGTGTALAGVLGSLGTATNGAVSATNDAINLQASKTGANIDSQLAAAGISRDSSTSALSHGDFDASVASTIASTDSQMELSEENTLISALQGEGGSHGPDESTWDSIMGGIGDAAQIAGMIAAV